MQSIILRNFLILIILVNLHPALEAQTKRSIPLDMYLIVDDSESFQNRRSDAMTWLNSQVLDRILVDGDRLNIWTAGDSAELIHSAEVSLSQGNEEIKAKLNNMKSEGKAADFSGALRDVETRISGIPEAASQERLSYTMLITASAEGLERALAGNSPGLLRWSRSERYERWQVLIVAPNITRKVQQSALAYMNSIRQ